MVCALMATFLKNPNWSKQSFHKAARQILFAKGELFCYHSGIRPARTHAETSGCPTPHWPYGAGPRSQGRVGPGKAHAMAPKLHFPAPAHHARGVGSPNHMLQAVQSGFLPTWLRPPMPVLDENDEADRMAKPRPSAATGRPPIPPTRDVVPPSVPADIPASESSSDNPDDLSDPAPVLVAIEAASSASCPSTALHTLVDLALDDERPPVSQPSPELLSSIDANVGLGLPAPCRSHYHLHRTLGCRFQQWLDQVMLQACACLHPFVTQIHQWYESVLSSQHHQLLW